MPAPRARPRHRARSFSSRRTNPFSPSGRRNSWPVSRPGSAPPSRRPRDKSSTRAWWAMVVDTHSAVRTQPFLDRLKAEPRPVPVILAAWDEHVARAPRAWSPIPDPSRNPSTPAPSSRRSPRRRRPQARTPSAPDQIPDHPPAQRHPETARETGAKRTPARRRAEPEPAPRRSATRKWPTMDRAREIRTASCPPRFPSRTT